MFCLTFVLLRGHIESVKGSGNSAFLQSFGTFEKRAPGVRFSKVPKLFGRISGDIILFGSSKRRRLKARNFAVISIFTPFTTYEKTSFTE